MISGGHQVGSHTWSHADLATLTAAEITDQMAQLETAHVALIGKAPTYMRPPYLSTNDLAVSTLTTLGYHIVSVDIDTFDYNEGPAGRIQNSINWFEGNQTSGGSIVLNHDPFEQTADVFVPAVITYLNGKGLKCKC
jgi:peptidoglycan/xylan/chitin deacetylase (PgdA/CDA1 family)